MSRWLLVAVCLGACGPSAPSGPAGPDSLPGAPQATPGPDAGATLRPDASAGATAEQAPDAPDAPPEVPAPAPLAPAPSAPEEVRWLLVAGGPEPSSNQIQIAHDAERAILHLGPGGQVLFGGGPVSPSVLVAPRDDAPLRGDPLIRRLGELFAPRAGRNAHYASPPFASHDDATAPHALAALERAVTAPTTNPLLVLLDGHGDRADTPDDAAFATWGGGWLTPKDLEPLLARATRPLRFVVATCYAGGWAPAVYAHDGACGVFATTWDRVSSGCDPDPDRSAQEGYLVRLFGALGRSSHADLDRDGDGQVGLLDAHFAAAAESRGLEVPVASSSQYLLASAPEAGPEARAPPGPLPEESWLVERLATALSPHDDAPLTEAEVDAKVAELAAAATDAAMAETDASDREAEALASARGDALARWPVLDDPWHPDWVPTLATHKQAIADWLRTSSSYAAWADATEALDRASQAADAIDLARARWLRLAGAQHVLTAARRLAALPAARMKPIWARFMALRTCERRPLP